MTFPQIFVWTVAVFSQIHGQPSSDSMFCRDSWVTSMPYEDFEVYSCSKCYVQVFWDEKDLKIMYPPTYPYLLHSNLTDITNDTVYYPDAHSEHSQVCERSLSARECTMWKDCCKAARHCCLHTQQEGKLAGMTPSCPATWDGISCWSATPGGHTEEQSCPSYYVLDHVTWSSPKVSRLCDEDSSWQANPDTGQEFSDYKQCYDMQPNIDILRISLYIDFTGNGISIIFLVMSIIIILSFRELRHELLQRNGLKLHFNLFVSVLCTSIFTVSFHSIYHDAFTNYTDAVYQENAIWCRALHILTKYFKSTTYMCMFCEGLFLYKRISQVLQIGVTEGLHKYILISWGLPLITVGVYVIVRVALGHNKKCWIDDNGLSNLEYIHMLPNLLSLVCNLVFLISIQYMLCTKMRSDTSDRRVEVLRHAIRATMSLIPIFGLQFLFLIYRPKNWPPYEIIVAIFQSTQGMLVAILYCFTTREVKTVLASHLQSCRRRQNRRRNVSLPKANVKVPRLKTSSRERLDHICARIQRVVTRKQPAASKDNSLPDVIECGVYLEPNAHRRDSTISKTTQKSFTDGSGSSINSQPIYKFDTVAKDKSTRLCKNGSIQMEHLDVRENTRRNTPSPVRLSTDEGDISPTAPLMETNFVEMAANHDNNFPGDKMLSPILSPIMETESQSITTSS